jgi:hypothetical protein
MEKKMSPQQLAGAQKRATERPKEIEKLAGRPAPGVE